MGCPGKEELLKLNRICEDVRHREDQLANAQTTARALKQVAAQKKPEKASPLPLVLGCLALVLGVGLSFVQVLAGVRFCCSGTCRRGSFCTAKREKTGRRFK